MGSLEGLCQSQGSAGDHSDSFMGTFVLWCVLLGIRIFQAHSCTLPKSCACQAVQCGRVPGIQDRDDIIARRGQALHIGCRPYYKESLTTRRVFSIHHFIKLKVWGDWWVLNIPSRRGLRPLRSISGSNIGGSVCSLSGLAISGKSLSMHFGFFLWYGNMKPGQLPIREQWCRKGNHRAQYSACGKFSDTFFCFTTVIPMSYMVE